MLHEKLVASTKQKKVVCTSHHLLSVLEQAFGVSVTRLSKDKALKKLVEKGSLQVLDNGGVWNVS